MAADVFGRLSPDDIGAAHEDHNHGGLGKTYHVHEQSPASNVWTIVHNLGYRPAGIRVIDSSGSEWRPGNIQYMPDNNTIVLTWSAEFSGTAYLS